MVLEVSLWSAVSEDGQDFGHLRVERGSNFVISLE